MGIVDISNETVRLESNDKESYWKTLFRVHWDPVEATMLTDDSATMTIRYLHMTNKGESITQTGTGTQMTPNKRGIAKVNGEGTMWTSAPLNGGRWTVEGEVNTIKETVEVKGNFTISGMQKTIIINY